MRIEEITVEVRSTALGRLGEIPSGDLVDLQLIKRFRNVGSWQMTLPTEMPMAKELAKPGRGLLVTGPSNRILMSGGMINATITATADDPQGMYSYIGSDDMIHLADALAWPSPNIDNASAQTAAYDILTTNAETALRSYFARNIVPGSAPASRAIAGLAVQGNLGRGATVTARARFDNLGKLMSDIASVGGLGFDLVQNGLAIELVIYQPTDKSATIRMDIDNSMIDSVTYGVGAPSGTRGVIAGQGEALARRFIQVTDSAAAAAETAWRRKIEVFKDRRDTPDDAELIQEGVDLVTTNGRTVTSLSVVPSDEVTMVYGKDWFLGDIVGVEVAGQPLKAVVTEAIIAIGTGGVYVGATIGDSTGFDYESKLIAAQQDNSERLAFLEKNAEFSSIIPIANVTGLSAALAAKNDITNVASRASTEVASTYPLGVSSMFVNAASGGAWPNGGIGTVLTVRGTATRTYQQFVAQSNGRMWIRSEGSADNWGAWNEFKMQDSGRSLARTVFTPTFGGLTLGNGTVAASYSINDGLVFVVVTVTAGSTTTMSATELSVGIPVSRTTSELVVGGGGRYVHSGTGTHDLVVLISGTSALTRMRTISGTYVVQTAVSSSAPGAISAGDSIALSFSYPI